MPTSARLFDREPCVAGESLVVLPHLVVIQGNVRPCDVIVWEVLPHSTLAELGQPDYQLAIWRYRLQALVALKRALRAGVLAKVSPDVNADLQHALRERYLSFLFVLEHRALVEEGMAALIGGKQP
jgi:hypothetical protein